MVLEYMFLGNSNHEYNFYNTYNFFADTKYLEEIKASFNQISISSQILMREKYKIEIEKANNSYEEMDIFKEKLNINIATTQLIVKKNKSNTTIKIQCLIQSLIIKAISPRNRRRKIV